MTKKQATLADQIKAARLAHGWTQVEAAWRLGVDPNTWARWEQGRARPEWGLLERVAKVLGYRLRVELSPRRSSRG